MDNDKKFRKAVKPLFSNSDPVSNKIILVENGQILQEETQVAESLSSHFWKIIDMLGLDSFFTNTDQNKTVDQIVNQAIEKYKNHDCLLRIKEKTEKKKRQVFHPSDLPMLTHGKYRNRSRC